MIDKNIVNLVAYAYRTGLIEKEDIVYSLNTILMQFNLTELDGTEEDVIKEAESIDQKKIDDGTFLEDTMKVLCQYAADNKIIEGTTAAYTDLFDTKLMGLLTPRPSEVIGKFKALYLADPIKATDWYYTFSRDTDYIRKYRFFFSYDDWSKRQI